MLILWSILIETWSLTQQMAPYLLIGFFGAGLMRMFLSEKTVTRMLGNGGIKDIFRATLIGTPLPLCSCSVIPVTVSLKKQGASREASTAFLTTTPETGIDSILASWSLLGPVFSITRVITAVTSGISSGLASYFFDKEKKTKFSNQGFQSSKNNSAKNISLAPKTPALQFSPVSSTQTKANNNYCCSGNSKKETDSFIEAMSYAFITLPKSIGKALILGLLIAGIVSALLPGEILASYLKENQVGQLVSYAVVSLLAIPIYVCSVGSIPIALALVSAGASGGAALVFILTGPATNAATIAAAIKILGKKSTLFYLLSILLNAWLAAYVLDKFFPTSSFFQTAHIHEESNNIIQFFSAITLIALFIYAFIPFNKKVKSCCSK